MNFDSQLSRLRYHLVNSLFDTLITFRVRRLNALWADIHRAETALLHQDRPRRGPRLKRPAAWRPADTGFRRPIEDTEFTSIFVRKQPGRSLPERQVQLEDEWNTIVSRNLLEALRIAEVQAASLEGRGAAGTGP